MLCIGRVFEGLSSHKDSSSSAKPRQNRKGGKSASTLGYLDLALRLQQLTEAAGVLANAGDNLDEALKAISEELADVEKEITDIEKGDDGSTVARDLRSMVSVIRGTMVQVTSKLTDEQVEKLGNSYTYANPRYWDEYYKKTNEDERFDWYGSWDSAIADTTFSPRGSSDIIRAGKLGDIMRPYLSPEAKILMFGCGNSDMSEKMYHAGYQEIVNIDISEQLIDNLRARLASSMPHMRWMYMNASDLSFEAESFDLTIDKGTLDAVSQNLPLLQAAVREAHRTLRPGGLFMSITYEAPPVRVDKQLRDAAHWGDCYSHPFKKKGRDSSQGGPSEYHLHVCLRA